MGKESDRAMLRQGLWRPCEALKGLDRPLRAYAGPGGLVRPSRAPVKGHTTALRAVAAEKRDHTGLQDCLRGSLCIGKTFSLYRGTQGVQAPIQGSPEFGPGLPLALWQAGDNYWEAL